MGLVPGFSDDNILQSDLFTYVPRGRNLFFSCDPAELFCCSVRSVTVLSHQFTTDLSVAEDLAQGYIISWLCQETATKIKL